MEQHVFNLFPVTNQNDLSISYRLVDVIGELGAGSDDPDLPAKNLNLLAKKVAFGQKLPVAIINGGDKPVLAVAANHGLAERQYQLTPHVARLSPRDEVRTVAFGDLDDSTRDIALSFLGWELRGQLYEHPELWRRSPSAFYKKQPVNAEHRNRELDVYGGFSPRFIFVEGLLHIAVPVVYCYSDSRWADQAFPNNAIKRLGGRTMLYHYGGRLFPIKFQKRTGKTVREQEFFPDGSNAVQNVFQWTVKNGGASTLGRQLQPDSPAICYKYFGNDKDWYGALSRCKLMLKNEDPLVASSRRDHQRTPAQRIQASEGIVSHYLSGLSLSGIKLKIEPTPRRTTGKCFTYPLTEYGMGKIVRFSENPKDDEISLADLPQTRKQLLENKNVGFAVLSDVDDQILIAPRSLGVTVVNDLKSRIEALVSSLIRKSYTLQLVRYQDEQQRTLRDQVEGVVGALNENEVLGGRGILILPSRARPDLHNYIKKKLRNRVQFQCMAAEKISRFYGTHHNNGHQPVQPQPQGRFQNYLLNTIMGLMIVNRQWPWVLHEPTHYDVYIGLDVLDHTAALTFFYKGGRLCAMRDQESSDKERLSRRVVAKLVYDGLKQDLPDTQVPPRSIVLRRDGRLFESEWLGFQDAINALLEEGVLPSNIQIGAVEIPKHHSYGIRLVELAEGTLRNPALGRWERISDTEGLVCTTGWPFNVPGTVEPLVTRVVRGSLRIDHILEDTFGMSQLCWPAPTGCMRLSIDLKLCDEHLRAFAAQADEDSALFGEAEESSEEPLLTAAN